jgi:PAS domain-containing protein
MDKASYSPNASANEIELNAIFQNVPMLMLLLDSDRRIKAANHLAVQATGRTAEEMQNMRGGEALRCIHALDDPQGCGCGPNCQTCIVRNTVLETFRTSTARCGVEGELKCSRDSAEKKICLRLSAIPLIIKNSPRVLICIEDISRQKQADEERQSVIKLFKIINSSKHYS